MNIPSSGRVQKRQRPENLMDDRSRKWDDRRRLEREGDGILELLEKHEKKEAEENREKKAEERQTKMGGETGK